MPSDNEDQNKDWRHFPSTLKIESFLWLHPEEFCGLRTKKFILKFNWFKFVSFAFDPKAKCWKIADI